MLYPFERLDIPKGFRGKPIWDEEKCSLKCRGVCAMDCPAQAIVMEKIDKKASRPIFHLDSVPRVAPLAQLPSRKNSSLPNMIKSP
ncbi:MAG: hypothetical protein COY46_04615 [Chloroflexi bacterium CG_4_10_14_0_8_um_filter_46_9]|nr:MAG: hypothetical protein AUK39_00660 [Dehalococcoidia bacterium CG2_30_46_19]PIZ26559.1 MAG: hypothetical protein COY46_04615 [Chloroflexi bacterium CG_4_10_14_0_8_um_filter_46_9]